MAGILVHQVFCPPKRHDGRPRRSPRRGILNRELIRDGIGVDQRKTFDDVQMVVDRPAPAAELIPRLVVEIRGVHDERVALPTTARISCPHSKRRRRVRPAVERHDPRRVNHLVMNHDAVVRLDNLDVLVVADADHRRP